ncbi:hypothetical protein DKX38_014410 [Salix brachista]|uniref:AP2/ERF domain-containing protein n=1 Tax=Salix brachista TaxID=2182728 RepID=A0A5N5LHL5_9ROSI|nr:hypothetical protein DKX38_014410 [Salix brachista]
MAARAHDVAALALRGRSACLNFADSAWRLPVPASSEAKDIQKAAAEAFQLEGSVGGLLANMAEGMVLPPPHCGGGGDGWGNMEDIDADMSLWITVLDRDAKDLEVAVIADLQNDAISGLEKQRVVLFGFLSLLASQIAPEGKKKTSKLIVFAFINGCDLSSQVSFCSSRSSA